MRKQQDGPGVKQLNPLDASIAELRSEIADMKNEAIFREDWVIDVLYIGDFLKLGLGHVTEGKTESGDYWYSRWVEYTFGEDTDVFRVISSGSRKQDILEINKLSKRRLYYVLLKKYLGVNPRGIKEVKDKID
jgi:hypothetical protein